MFIQNLNNEQQAVLLELCEQIILADDNGVDSAEEQMMKVIQAQCNTGVTRKSVEKAGIIKLFDTDLAKCSLLLELLGIAYANNDYHSKQAIFIKEYAELLSITPAKLVMLEYWIKEQFLLMEKINLLINNNF
ncbi:DNA repair protein [Mergibacter septicus]|uniref:DNA repair protein n=1 Tax=Mergibacter septicus TaxID=221402 RepID=UPI001C7446CE|nr:DNA repair protein [Mergibacter septicus]QDJ13204.1 DNA repair protein [Mergibacter septicus]